ncbi:MAG: hypothetical protein KDB68_01150 [Planctomycetes bacterium]|nr:hypothetical protein [Planctomycetota bacterium]
MNEPKPNSSDHGAPGPHGAPSDPSGDEQEDITDIVHELTEEHQRRQSSGESSHDLREFDGDASQAPSSNPYFRPQEQEPTTIVPALRPLSDAVINPVPFAEPSEAIALEPTSDDSTLNEAILTKRLPLPPKAEKQEVTMEEIESIVAEIPEARGSDTDIRQVLPQSKVIEDPGLLFNEGDLDDLQDRLRSGLLASLVRSVRDRAELILTAQSSVPFDLDYYSLRSVGNGASIIENPTMLEAAFIGRLYEDDQMMRWALDAVMRKCRAGDGRFHDRAGADPETPPGRGCVAALRDISLAMDFLAPVLDDAHRAEIAAALYNNGLRLANFINDARNNAPSNVSENGALALGLAGLPLMNFENYYVHARRWTDSAEQRAQSLLESRIAENGRPAASDLQGLVELMRYLLPFSQAFQRYYGDNMLMGEGGNLSALPVWLAHQFGSNNAGLFASSSISVEDLFGATPLLAKAADTFRDGVAQWLLHQISVAGAAHRAGSEDRPSSKYRIELQAHPGIDSVLTCVFYDPSLQVTSPDTAIAPGARLSETRAVVRSDWDPSSPIVTLQSEAGTLPYVHLASSGVNLKLSCDPGMFRDIGGMNVVGRVRDYVDMGSAAYINGDFKGSEGSLAQRHLLYLRSEGVCLLFDRFDIGDGRTLKRGGLRIEGSEETTAVDRGTLGVRATDGSDRQARFVFFSNGFSQGVEEPEPNKLPGLGVEFMRGRGDLATIITLGRAGRLPPIRRINTEERGRVYRTTFADGAVLFNGWPNGMPQQCGWIWTDALMCYVDRRDDYPGRYVAIKSTSVLAYDMHEGIHIGFGASHPEDPNKPVEFSMCASGAQAVIHLSTRAHLRVAFPGLKKVYVDGNEVDIEGDAKVFVISQPLEPGRHLVEFEHESPGPESTIITPREDQFVGGEFTLHASIGDPIGVASARLLVDGEYLGATVEANPWVWKVNANSLSEGRHEAMIEATDVLGHVRRSVARSFIVDNTPPEVELLEPKEGKKARGVFTFVAAAEDSNGIERVQFCLNGKKVGEPVTAAPYARDIDTTEFPDATYAVTALAFDAAGNVGQSKPARMTLANTAPPPEMIKLKIKPPVLAVKPLEEVHLECVGIDDEDGEQPVRVQWRRIKGQGVVDKNNVFTAPGAEGPVVMEAQIVGTHVRAKLHAVVSLD